MLGNDLMGFTRGGPNPLDPPMIISTDDQNEDWYQFVLVSRPKEHTFNVVETIVELTI